MDSHDVPGGDVEEPLAPDLPEDLLVARRPMCGRDLEPVGYEIVFRDEGGRLDPDSLLAALGRIDISRLAGDRLALVELPGGLPVATGEPPAARLALAVPEAAEESAIARIEEAAASGWSVIADGAPWRPELRRLLDLAEAARIDIRGRTGAELEELTALLRPASVKLLAAGVETAADLQTCRSLGFDWYQGEFMVRPGVLDASERRMGTLATAGEVCSEGLDLEAIERIVSRDVGLSYRLLHLLNSAYVGLPNRISSIRQALVMMGEVKAREWITVVLVSEAGRGATQLLETALTRARLAELIGRRAWPGRKPGSFFLTGLFSVSDALVDRPLAEAVEPLPLTRDIKAGLIDRTGPEGRILSAVLRYEQGDPAAVRLSGIDVPELYLEAVLWADGICRASDPDSQPVGSVS